MRPGWSPEYLMLRGKHKAPSGFYSRKEAVEEAKRCYLCECKTCVAACEYLQYYGGYPRKYVNDILQTVKSLQGIGGKAAGRR